MTKRTTAPLEPVEIFRAGSHRSMNGALVTVTPEQLAETARSYNAEKHEAPVVIGHPRTDAPAFGWVKGLHMKGESLFATLDDVASEFAEQVKAGRFKKISASFWMSDSPENPQPGVMALKHVGFLGAAVPSVKGMRQARFSTSNEGVVDFADPELIAMQAEFDAALRRTENESFVEKMIVEGRMIPVQKSGLLAFMDRIDNASVLSFAEGGETVTTGHLEWFKGFLSSLPQVVSFGAVKIGNGPEGGNDNLNGLQVPDGYTVARDSIDAYSRAAAHAKANNLSFAEAVKSMPQHPA